ncbi:MAG: HD domain-containing protein [Anaerolineales bacterium]|nr:HD domain-containing protein [Anaerolineales bacterium]
MALIQEIENIVEAACAADSNMFGYDIWTHHIVPVVENSRRLAPLFEADEEIVVVSALLHDYASVKDPALYEDHHVHGPIEAEKVLRRLDYPAEKIEAVKYCIANHRGSVPSERSTPEAECLANADALAHLQNVPSLLYLVYTRRDMDIDQGVEWLQNKLARSWNKLSPQVREMADERYRAAQIVLSTSSLEEIK